VKDLDKKRKEEENPKTNSFNFKTKNRKVTSKPKEPWLRNLWKKIITKSLLITLQAETDKKTLN